MVVPLSFLDSPFVRSTDPIGMTIVAPTSTQPNLDAATSLLAQIARRVGEVSVDGLDAVALRHVADAARSVQRSVDGLLMRVGMTANAAAEEAGTETDRADDVIGSRGGRERSATVRRDAERAAAAGVLPRFGCAAAQGRVGADQMDSVARAARRLGDDAHLLNNPALVEDAASLPADTFDRRLRRLVAELQSRQADRGAAEAEAKRSASEVRYWFDEISGMGKLFAELDPERFEAVTSAIEQQLASLAATGQGQRGPNLAADAFVALVTGSGERAGHLPHINIVVGNGQAETANGHNVAPASVDRLSCDAVMRRVVMDAKSVAIDVGRAVRTATSAQWAALRSMYVSCAWKDCTAPVSWCQAHHIEFWRHGGRTDLENLVPLCSRHHHRVHEGGWGLDLRANDRRLRILKPTGTVWAETWPDRRPMEPTIVQRE